MIGRPVLAGRYALREVLGTDCIGTISRATDEVVGHEVAANVLSSQYAADNGFLARLKAAGGSVLSALDLMGFD